MGHKQTSNSRPLMTAFSQEATFRVRWRHQPLRDVVLYGVSFWQAGFAEAVHKVVHVVGIGKCRVILNEADCDLRLAPLYLVKRTPGFVQPPEMARN